MTDRQHLTVQFLHDYLSSGVSQELIKTKEDFKPLPLKVWRIDLGTFGILENWSLKSGGPL